MKRVRHRGDQGIFYRGLPVHAPPGVHEQAIEILRKHVHPPAQVMELGAGSGAFTERLMDSGYNVDAVDYDPSDWTLTSVPLAEQDLNAPVWDIPKGCYHAVVAIEVLEHLENPSSFFRNARDLLKPGGILLCTIPNVVSVDSRRRMLLKGEMSFFGRGSLSEIGHLTIMPYWLVEDLLGKEHYQVVERRFIGRQELVFRPNRVWWKCVMTPIVDLLLLLLGPEVPTEAAFNSNVVFVAAPSRELQA